MTTYLIILICVSWLVLAASILIGRSASKEMPRPSHLYDWEQEEGL